MLLPAECGRNKVDPGQGLRRRRCEARRRFGSSAVATGRIPGPISAGAGGAADGGVAGMPSTAASMAGETSVVSWSRAARRIGWG